MTKPKKSEKPKSENVEEEKQFDELIGALLKVPRKKPEKKKRAK